jgi:hypothetical protein
VISTGHNYKKGTTMTITQKNYPQSDLCRSAKENLMLEEQAMRNSKRLKVWRARYTAHLMRQSALREQHSGLKMAIRLSSFNQNLKLAPPEN